ncbi:hypothetical protein [Mycolicibacter sinensis]|uniref:hypothetical protein n=1 Tax=Mycolicibacter sinensis (strain JDM601) TaxID=875328 RepID=UPI000673FEB0|nr:hypothetical protein [Mycolicibacter sinensis]
MAHVDPATLNRLADAVVALDPQPRERRWTSLSLCIVDAVWSIGADYDSVVVPVVRTLAGKLGVGQPTVPATEPIGADPLPVTRIAEISVDEMTALTNRQRTSTRNGILKSDAVLRHARMFAEHHVGTMAEAVALFADAARFDTLDAALRPIPGEGGDGIRRGYLWMLIGQDDLIKPDRMVLRWLDHVGVSVDPKGARNIITQLIPVLAARLGRDVTAWEVDHAMWKAGRALGRGRGRRFAKGDI